MRRLTLIAAVLVHGEAEIRVAQPAPIIGFALAAAAFVLLMILRRHGVNLNITHMRHHDQVRPTDEPR